MFSRKEITIGVLVAFLGMVLAYSCRLEAGEWNEKPVMCASEEETYKTINEKEEVLIFTGLEFAKVRSETGYKAKSATLPFRFYINLETGTYTMIEYHPEYASYCVISYGVNLQTFGGDIL